MAIATQQKIGIQNGKEEMLQEKYSIYLSKPIENMSPLQKNWRPEPPRATRKISKVTKTSKRTKRTI